MTAYNQEKQKHCDNPGFKKTQVRIEDIWGSHKAKEFIFKQATRIFMRRLQWHSERVSWHPHIAAGVLALLAGHLTRVGPASQTQVLSETIEIIIGHDKWTAERAFPEFKCDLRTHHGKMISLALLKQSSSVLYLDRV